MSYLSIHKIKNETHNNARVIATLSCDLFVTQIKHTYQLFSFRQLVAIAQYSLGQNFVFLVIKVVARRVSYFTVSHVYVQATII